MALVGAFFALWGAYVIWQLSYALTDPVFRAHSYRHFLGISDALLFYVLPGVICVAAGTRPIRRVTMGSVQQLPRTKARAKDPARLRQNRVGPTIEASRTRRALTWTCDGFVTVGAGKRGPIRDEFGDPQRVNLENGGVNRLCPPTKH